MTFSPFLAPERDGAFKRGRAKTAATTFYTLPGVWYTALGGLIAPTVGRDYYAPIFVETPIVVDQLVAYVDVAAAGNMRMGLYVADSSWQPTGGPLADSGDISTSTTGVKTYTPGTPVYLRRGRYLTVLNHSVAATFRSVRGFPPGVATYRTTDPSLLVTEWRVTRAYAAFPTPGTAWDTTTDANNMDQMVWVRVLTP